MGWLDEYVPAARKGEVFLRRGIYRLRGGELRHSVGGLTLHGDGKGETVLVGDVHLRGDGYTLLGLTIAGRLTLRGNNCRGDIEVEKNLDVAGKNNRGF